MEEGQRYGVRPADPATLAAVTLLLGGIAKAPAAEAVDSALVLAQLDRILSTPLFQHSKRYPTFLRYVVEQTLNGECDELKSGPSVSRFSSALPNTIPVRTR